MTEPRRGYCGYCQVATTGFLEYESKDPWHIEEHGTHGIDRHFLLRCAGCKNIFYQLVRTHSENVSYSYGLDGTQHVHYDEDFEHYPQQPRIERPAWLPDLMRVDPDLHSIMHEIYMAYDHELLILATTGIRTAIDRLLEGAGIDPNLSFNKKIDAAAASNVVDPRLIESMKTLVEIGHGAIHRKLDPNESDVRKLLPILERIIDSACFSPDPQILQGLKGLVPPRKK